MHIISFKGPLESSKLLYKNQKILQLTDIAKRNNYQLVFDQINKNLPDAFEQYFTQNADGHNTRRGILNVPMVNTTKYGSNSITLKAIKDWSNLLTKVNLRTFTNNTTTVNFLKKLKTEMLNSYK